ncbi:MAG: hypothetical protein K1X79_03820 [Oligoflexia bacterium]|nr:hypothetical protein [Oligoflexia bacterium]
MMRILVANQHGFTEMLPLAFLLPLAVLLLAGVVDFSRAPTMKERLLTVLEDSAFRAERSVTSDYSVDLMEPIAPAGNILCSYVATDAQGDCSDMSTHSGKQALMTDSIAQLIVDESCKLMGGLDQQIHGFFGTWGSDARYAAQFAIMRISYDATSGELGSADIIATSADDCTPNQLSFSDYSADIGVTTESIKDRIKSFVQDQSPPAGAWYIENDSALQAYTTTIKPYLSSYWLLGVGYLRVQHLFPKLFGEYAMAAEYFVRPFNNPAAIERGGL